MANDGILGALNEILKLEYTAVLQYTYEGFVVTGLDRPRFLAMFQGEAAESLAHAQMVGSKIVSLGGTPTSETMAIATTRDLREMLENNLAMERKAVELYTAALVFAGDDVSLRTMLENQISIEKGSVEELEQILA
ncbi:MAG: bacterioferritin [Dehalococcoidia bacterium]